MQGNMGVKDCFFKGVFGGQLFSAGLGIFLGMFGAEAWTVLTLSWLMRAGCEISRSLREEEPGKKQQSAHNIKLAALEEVDRASLKLSTQILCRDSDRQNSVVLESQRPRPIGV